jgi:hypothetical protein
MRNIHISRINLSTILQVCLIVMCLFLLLRKPTQVYPVSKQKVIEKRIEGKETIIKQQGKVIDNSEQFIAELNAGLLDLHSQLDNVKNSKDTFNIVQIQDTMIHVLYRRDKEKDVIIAAQDTIIQAQRYIINAKDTIIATKDFDLKRIKRQRNISILLNGLLTTGLIIK